MAGGKGWAAGHMAELLGAAGVASVKRRCGAGGSSEGGAGGGEGGLGGSGFRAEESSATMRKTMMVLPARISSPLARVDSLMRAPLRKVPLLLSRSRTRQPRASHSKAQWMADMRGSLGKACSALLVRPMRKG